MPDLGKYAVDVLLAYGATAVLLGALIVATATQARKSREQLNKAEKKSKQ